MHRILVLIGAALVAALLTLSAGCGSDAPADDKADGPPQRIVSLSATATESLFAIGAGRQVVAVDEFSDYPPEAPRTKLSGATPNAEAIARLRPDLVVLSADANDAAGALKRLDISVLVQPPAASLDDAYEQIEQLGQATGHASEAARVTREMRRRLAQLADSVPRGGEPISVYHEIGPDGYSAGSGTYVGAVYRLFGLRNIADAAGGGSDYPQLSPEHIVRADPDLIVLADTTCCEQSARTVAKRPGWEHIEAVDDGRVVEVDDAVAARWGPRLLTFAGKVARAARDARR